MSDAQRTDIQGLRAVAVLAVLGVHAWPEQLRGGFVGVDIFFVVSGYLISRPLWREQAQGHFRLRRFYERRALRLFPALALVLAFCVVVAALFTFPSQASQVGRHAAAGALFASNLALWQESGYFDAASETKPLLHLWSLGIEEQFYLLWPPVALLIGRLRRCRMAAVVVLALLSFALNAAFVEDKAKGVFFLLPTRAWELLAGAALAQADLQGMFAALGARARETLAWTGAVLLLLALAWLDKGMHYPGWWALLPTLGTLALLAAGPGTVLARRLLAQPVLQFYGRISYPLYLWHWPLLVFPQLLGIGLDHAARAAVLAASVALAHLTTEYVERPLRFGPPSPRRPWRLAGVLAGVGATGALLHVHDGAVEAYPPLVRAVARVETGFDFGVYRAARCFLDLEQTPAALAPECLPPAQGVVPRVLVWGDSHAASLYPGLAAWSTHRQPVPLLAQITKARCPPLPTVPPAASHGCAETAAFALQRIAADPPRTVVLGGHWSLYGDDDTIGTALLGTVQRLQQAGVQRVVIVGHLPAWRVPLPRLLLRAWSRSGQVPERAIEGLDPGSLRSDRALRTLLRASGAVYVSPFEQLCDGQGCLATRAVDGVAQPMAFDETHLTAEGSRVLVAGAVAAFLD